MAGMTFGYDVLGVFRRRKAIFLIPFLLLSGLALAAALMLPPSYEATATIRIDRQQIPRDLIETGGASERVDEYLQLLRQRVLTDEHLWEVAEELDLLPEQRAAGNRRGVAATLRSRITSQTVYAGIGPPDARHPEAVAVAFAVTYRSGVEGEVDAVTNRIAELYLSVHEGLRAQQAARLTEFLSTESSRLAEKVDGLEARLEAFRREHAGNLPEQADLNIRRMNSLQDQEDRIRERISALTEQQIALQGELARLEPFSGSASGDRSGLTPAQQVERLRADYLALSARFSPQHPDVSSLRVELRALVGVTPEAERVLQMINALEAADARLQNASRRHPADHPDLVSLRRTVEDHRSALAAAQGGTDGGASARPDNPAYVTVSTRLRSVEADLQSEQEMLERVRQRARDYERRLSSSPAVERQYQALMREYESALAEYRDTRDRRLRAEAAEKAERARIGDQFTLLSYAAPPEGPAGPNRAGIAVLGFIFASGVGTGLAALGEYFTRGLRGARSVVEIMGAPPIATIPVIRTRREKRRRLLRIVFTLSLLLLLAGAIAYGIHMDIRGLA